MPRNDTATPGHVCPGIRIHAIDIVQPPGIDISPIADMDEHQRICASCGIHCGCVEPKKDRDQASARQRQNFEVDIRADVLDCSANPHCA
jgi:hypothetical protein